MSRSSWTPSPGGWVVVTHSREFPHQTVVGRVLEPSPYDELWVAYPVGDGSPWFGYQESTNKFAAGYDGDYLLAFEWRAPTQSEIASYQLDQESGL